MSNQTLTWNAFYGPWTFVQAVDVVDDKFYPMIRKGQVIYAVHGKRYATLDQLKDIAYKMACEVYGHNVCKNWTLQTVEVSFFKRDKRDR